MATSVDPRCRYTKSHEWIRVEEDTAYCGITDYAQEQLSDIVFVEMPEQGDSFAKGEMFGVVESVKAASDCYLPAAGEVVKVNEELEASPDLVNSDPYGDGWFVQIILEDEQELSALMTSDAYVEYVDRLEEDEEGDA